ncbi:uncharacterized protein LOC133360194 isoform X4 [Lethenteron reissneri]|uniref:uncharacterized protein LOC133360194 isoform X4 n=1 Tax=Lethenteron reissneri TaxID=7753 RepID=UPI002AB6FC4C|nr:uncharacterized protein LOC133360194 isoform X4 [Lethenteron reissneri]
MAKALIRRHKTTLMRWISRDPTHLLDELDSRGHIQRELYKAANDIADRMKQARSLLDHFIDCSEEGCEKLLRTLRVVCDHYPSELRTWLDENVAEVFTVWKQELTKTWENSLFAKMKTIEGNIKETNETMIREIKVISEQLEVLKEGVPICQNCANVNVSGQPSAELLVPPKDRIVLSNQLTPQPESQILKTTPTSDVFTAFSENGPDQTAMDTSDDSAPVEEESAFHYSPVPKSKLSTCHLENVETYAALFSGAPGAGKVSPITEATAAEAAAGDVLGTLENRQKTRERKQKSPTKKKGTVHYHMRDHKHGSTESALCKKMKPMHIRKRQSSAKKVKSTGGDAVISEYPSVVNRKTRIIRSMCHERL